MLLDPVAFTAAAVFTAGCAGIHALRHHADSVTLVLSLLACGLALVIGSILAGRHDASGVVETIPAWALAASAGP